MRRSICFCEPHHANAGETKTWKFIYTTASNLPKGAKLRFDMQSSSRPTDWQIPQTNLKDKTNLIWAEMPEQQILSATLVPNTESCFEFTLPQEVKIGDQITIFVGTPNFEESHQKGNTSQKNLQRKRPFVLFIDPKGKGEFKEQEAFFLDVRGGQLKTLRVIAPSLVARNKRFDVIVRFEDMYGNLTCNAPEGTLIELSYKHLRENLNWKLFVPETGFIALPNLYFNEIGIYKIQLKNLKTNEVFHSPPIKCLPEGAPSLFWGSLHNELERFDSLENVESWLRHIRDDLALQFIATSCFDSEEETSQDQWKAISQQIAEFNEDDRFVALLGFQWHGEPYEEGLRQFIYTKDSKPILRKKDTKSNSLKKIYKTNNPKEMMAIPSFTMGKSTCFNFEDFNPEFERVVEIYNAWGSSEAKSSEQNLRPISGNGKNTISESAEGSIIKALNEGCRFGFISGGFDDRGPYANLYDTNQAQYTPGLTAVLAKEHNRSSLVDAIYHRSCYATTGAKMIIGIHVAGAPMGSELDTKTRPGLEFNRYITGYVIGTEPLTSISLIRNGKVIRSFEPKEDQFEIETDDSESLSSISLEGKEDRPNFIYYYLRAQQADGHIAWSSPIWVDVSQKLAPSNGKKLKKKVKDVE